MHDGNGLISGSWGHIDDQIVEVSPVYVLEELPDGSHLDRASPDDRCVLAGQEECHGHDLHGWRDDDGDELPVVVDHDLFILDSEHLGDVGSGDVDIHESDLESLLCHGDSEVGRYGTLSDSSLSAEDDDYVLDLSKTFLELEVSFIDHWFGHGGVISNRCYNYYCVHGF